MFKPHHKGRMVDDACQTVESSFEGFTPISTPRLIEGDFSHEEEALRYVIWARVYHIVKSFMIH